MSTFPYICEDCMDEYPMTQAEFAERADPNGRFLCDSCRAKVRPRRIRKTPDPTRRMGCIVTARADGRTWSIHRDGKTTDALREICDSLPEGAHVVCVSTWRTVLADLRNMRRRPGPSRGMLRDIDRFSVERTLLGRIGRLDLLPPEADPIHSHQPSSRLAGQARRRR